MRVKLESITRLELVGLRNVIIKEARRWESIAAGIGIAAKVEPLPGEISSPFYDLAFCEIFPHKNCWGDFHHEVRIAGAMVACPIKRATGQPGCLGSPYEAWVRHHQEVHPEATVRQALCPECRRLAGNFASWLRSLATYPGL